MTDAHEPSVADQCLVSVQAHLHHLRSNGPFMDTLTSEQGWTEPADPVSVRLYEAIIELSEADDAYLLKYSS